MQILLAAGANVNLDQGGFGKTPLVAAAGAGYAPTVRVLLSAGAEVTPMALSSAERGGHTEIVELLKKSQVEN